MECQADVQLLSAAADQPHKYKHVVLKSKSRFKKTLGAVIDDSCRGAVTGFLTGGIPGACGSALIFGTVPSIAKYFKDSEANNDSLIDPRD